MTDAQRTIDPKLGTSSQMPQNRNGDKLARIEVRIRDLRRYGCPDGSCEFHVKGPCFHPKCMESEGRRITAYVSGLADE